MGAKPVNVWPDRSTPREDVSAGEDALRNLVLSAQAGSAVAFEELAAAHGPRLSRYLIVRLGSRTEAEDVLQETLSAAWLGLPRLRDTTRFWPWLVGIASRKIADSRRGARETLLSEVPEASLLVSADTGLADVADALNRLSDKFRNVLLLRYVLGLNEAETAALLRVPVGTVKTRAFRARRSLRAALHEDNGRHQTSDEGTQ